MNPAYPVNPSKSASPWLVIPRPVDQARLRLFCFPYAGVGPVVYRNWPEGLPDSVEVVAVHYPGRESRLRETPFASIQPLLAALVTEIAPLLDRPFAFFGHSLGGLIAFELVRLLRQQRAPLPTHLLISSRRAPQLPDPYSPIHTLADAAFTSAVQSRYNGIPAVIEQDPELLAVFLPILRADFSILETYQYTPEPPFDFPITVFAGQQDAGVRLDDLPAWQTHTREPITVLSFPGDHFYLQKQRLSLLEAISKHLARHL